MKRLIQLNLLLLLISTASAQEAQPQEASPQQPTKILRDYDWNEVARSQKSLGVVPFTVPIELSRNERAQASFGEIISSNGYSILKIVSTNNFLQEISLLTISDSKLIAKAYFIVCEIKYENVFGNNPSFLKLSCHLSPAVPGSEGRTISAERDSPSIYVGSKDWTRCLFVIPRDNLEGLPTELKLQFIFQGQGTIYIRPPRLIGTVGNWWMPEQAGKIGGIGGSVIGCFGALLGLLASIGKARTFVLATMKIFIALGILLTIAGFVAVVSSQPYAVWYALLLPGVILTLVFSLTLPSIQRRYDELEIRRMTSVDAMGS
jgi:hypothetical protein